MIVDPHLVSEGMPELLPMLERSPGVHVSEVIHHLCVRLGHYEERGEIQPADRVRMELGCALEHAVIARYELDEPGRYIRPGEQEMDDLFGTPDLLDLEDWALIEIKLTWMSSNLSTSGAPEGTKFWKYWVQLGAYCQMVGVRVGRLHVCHVMGDYKYQEGSGPVYRVWEMEFTEEELQENWQMLKSHAEEME